MEERLFKIKHKPSGLFYGPKKGRWVDQITNFSKVGKFYGSKAQAEKVLNSDAKDAALNKAQSERHNIPLRCESRWRYNKVLPSELELVEYAAIPLTSKAERTFEETLEKLEYMRLENIAKSHCNIYNQNIHLKAVIKAYGTDPLIIKSKNV